MAQALLPQWSCAKCTPRLKEIRGCGKPGKNITLMGGEKYETCPKFFSFSHPAQFARIMRAYAYADKGILPEPGALEDQAAPLVHALSYVGKAMNEAHDYMMKHPPSKPGAPGARRDAQG